MGSGPAGGGLDALSDLYLEWDRLEDAATYERVLELNPDSEEAQEKLAGLR